MAAIDAPLLARSQLTQVEADLQRWKKMPHC
jgi:hypothetical protein